MNALNHKFGPYYYAQPDHKVTRTFKAGKAERTFTFILSTAYNAMGLIGPEYNGLVVLDDDKMAVLADRIDNASYDAPTKSQLELFRIVTSDEAFGYTDLAQMINHCARARYMLELPN